MRPLWSSSLLVALATLVGCAGGPAPPGGDEPPADTGLEPTAVLATNVGSVADLALAGDTVYALIGSPDALSLIGVPVAGGPATTLATGIEGSRSLAGFGSSCAYPDQSTSDAYLATPGQGTELISKGFSGEVGPWIASEGQVFFYARPSDGVIASVGLSAPGGGEDEPTAPPQLLKPLGTAGDPELLAAGEEHVYFAQNDRSVLARLPVGGTNETPEAVTTALGTLTDVDATGSRYIAAGTGGVRIGEVSLTSRGDVVAVALAGEGLGYATGDTVYGAAEGTSVAEVADGEGISHLVGGEGVLVFADATGGGRIALVDLTTPSDEPG